ncbi:MAG: 8-amino-7-oxononanoate synthase [Lentisphaeraceae bacterium]|nr:8-amino-7-oxononanoate synthase [Lentisphaeraceae bacterium]
MPDKYSDFQNFLEKCTDNHRFRTLKNFDSVTASRIKSGSKTYINFSSNDYLGLSSSEALNSTGSTPNSGSTASRLVCGNTSRINQLEELLAKWKQKEAALLFNSGYQANSTIIPAIADRKSIIFSDKLNHASIIDGIKLSGAKHVRYKHNDMEQLEELLKKHSDEKGRKIIISETLFSMDGDFADLKRISELAEKYNCLTYIDDAHGSGLSGENGIGPCEQFMASIDFYISTFGKALGSFGAFCASSQMLKDYLINSARGFIFSTALPPTIIETNIKAVEAIQNLDTEREALSKNIDKIRTFLKENSFNTIESDSPIIPIIIGPEKDTLDLSSYLLENDIFAVAIRPPTVPENTCRIRITVSSEHTHKDIDKLLSTLKTWKENLASNP